MPHLTPTPAAADREPSPTASPGVAPPAAWPPLVAFLAASWAALALDLGRFVPGPERGLAVLAFSVLTLFTYCALYLAPVALAALALERALRGRRAGRVAAAVAAVAGASIVHVALRFDMSLYRAFGFHMNGFVWNLVRTPGGLDSFGGGSATTATAVALGALCVAGHALASGLLLRGAAQRRAVALITVRRVAAAGGVLLLGWLAQLSAFAIADVRADRDVVEVAERFPLHLPVTIRHLAGRLGLGGIGGAPRGPRLTSDGGSVRYPLRPLELAPGRKRMNVVWLVSESLRADMLDPEVMPRTYAFAQRGQWFTNHMSGGCGTRMAMFSMFYGLWGPYWFPFLGERRGPVLLDHLRRDGYRIQARTSATFTYPEFDQTIWTDVPESLVTLDSGDAWERDVVHTDGILRFIDAGPAGTPFFSFMFFESPHARYSFPPDAVIRPDFLPELNYATIDLARDLPRVKDRYINACHHLDAQVGRILDRLEARGLLDSTIVVITGDHGEEFMEHGRWGHNSAFTSQQVHPPLVVWIPGRAPARHDELTSHLDLPATVLTALGVTNPPSDYSQGNDLLGPARRSWSVLADWSSVAYADAHDRVVLPIGERFDAAIVLHDDLPVEAGPSIDRHRVELLEIARGLSTFRR